jgi:hypothetical protein
MTFQQGHRAANWLPRFDQLQLAGISGLPRKIGDQQMKL